MAVMRSPVTATSARRPGAPVPSSTVPPRITRSAVMGPFPVRWWRVALPARQVCRDSGVVGQVGQPTGAVGNGFVREQPGHELVPVAIVGPVESGLAPAGGLHEQEVDALDLLAGRVLQIVGAHVGAPTGAVGARGRDAFGVACGQVRVDPALGDDRAVALRCRRDIEVAGEDANRLLSPALRRERFSLDRLTGLLADASILRARGWAAFGRAP